MIGTDEIQDLLVSGGAVVDDEGREIGQVRQVFLDDQSGNPEWVTVATGPLGTAESFIPLEQASIEGDTIRVPYDRATVTAAPRVDDADGRLSEAEEAELYRYYGLDRTTGTADDEEEHEVVLTEELPVVAGRTVPVERVGQAARPDTRTGGHDR